MISVLQQPLLLVGMVLAVTAAVCRLCGVQRRRWRHMPVIGEFTTALLNSLCGADLNATVVQSNTADVAAAGRCWPLQGQQALTWNVGRCSCMTSGAHRLLPSSRRYWMPARRLRCKMAACAAQVDLKQGGFIPILQHSFGSPGGGVCQNTNRLACCGTI
jgi:hypothetical protein